jgi:hypothetical protein
MITGSLSHGRNLELKKEYTLDEDFDTGTLINVNHDKVHNQLQLNPAGKSCQHKC